MTFRYQQIIQHQGLSELTDNFFLLDKVSLLSLQSSLCSLLPSSLPPDSAQWDGCLSVLSLESRISLLDDLCHFLVCFGLDSWLLPVVETFLGLAEGEAIIGNVFIIEVEAVWWEQIVQVRYPWGTTRVSNRLYSCSRGSRETTIEI